jgi:hypothetical protein
VYFTPVNIEHQTNLLYSLTGNNSALKLRTNMKLLKALPLLCLFTTAAPAAVTFFQHEYYAGGFVVDGSAFPDEWNAEYRTYLESNDEMSSVGIDSFRNDCVLLAKDSDFRGSSWLFLNSDTPSLGDLGWNDKVSSTVSFIPYNGCSESAIGVLYRDSNGRSDKFPLVPGGHPQILGWFNDRASSIRVPIGMEVTLYEHKNYGGNVITFVGNDQIINLGEFGWNDKVSSFFVWVQRN